MAKRKVVLLPVEVPDSDYCWEGHAPCTHFSNEGGHPTCDYNISVYLCYNAEGKVMKPKQCRVLKERTSMAEEAPLKLEKIELIRVDIMVDKAKGVMAEGKVTVSLPDGQSKSFDHPDAMSCIKQAVRMLLTLAAGMTESQCNCEACEKKRAGEADFDLKNMPVAGNC